MRGKRPSKSKTVWFSWIIMALGVVELVVGGSKMDPLLQGGLLIIIGSISLYLRYRTQAPLI